MIGRCVQLLRCYDEFAVFLLTRHHRAVSRVIHAINHRKSYIADFTLVRNPRWVLAEQNLAGIDAVVAAVSISPLRNILTTHDVSHCVTNSVICKTGST